MSWIIFFLIFSLWICHFRLLLWCIAEKEWFFLIISCLIKRSQKYNPHYLCKSKFFSTGETRVCSHHAAKKDAETLQLTLAEIGTAKEYGDIRKATLISWTKVCTSMCVPWLGSKLVSLHSTVLCKYTILLRAILGIPERANEPFR